MSGTQQPCRYARILSSLVKMQGAKKTPTETGLWIHLPQEQNRVQCLSFIIVSGKRNNVVVLTLNFSVTGI